jgi:16S rRNA G1207 methylase RsmC
LLNARAVVSDVRNAVLDERFDVVVANPPFHVGKHTISMYRTSSFAMPSRC